MEIGFWQCLHLPRRIIQEITGMLSRQEIVFLQCGQKERALKKFFSLTRRYATEFKNDPQQRRRGTTKKRMSTIVGLPISAYQKGLRFFVVFQTVHHI